MRHVLELLVDQLALRVDDSPELIAEVSREGQQVLNLDVEVHDDRGPVHLLREVACLVPSLEEINGLRVQLSNDGCPGENHGGTARVPLSLHLAEREAVWAIHDHAVDTMGVREEHAAPGKCLQLDFPPLKPPRIAVDGLGAREDTAGPVA